MDYEAVGSFSKIQAQRSDILAGCQRERERESVTKWQIDEWQSVNEKPKWQSFWVTQLLRVIEQKKDWRIVYSILLLTVKNNTFTGGELRDDDCNDNNNNNNNEHEKNSITKLDCQYRSASRKYFINILCVESITLEFIHISRGRNSWLIFRIIYSDFTLFLDAGASL